MKKLYISVKILFLQVVEYVVSHWKSKKNYDYIHQDLDFVFKGSVWTNVTLWVKYVAFAAL